MYVEYMRIHNVHSCTSCSNTYVYDMILCIHAYVSYIHTHVVIITPGGGESGFAHIGNAYWKRRVYFFLFSFGWRNDIYETYDNNNDISAGSLIFTGTLDSSTYIYVCMICYSYIHMYTYVCVLYNTSK